MTNKNIAIRINTERDMELAIPYFEKHYPNCNDLMEWKTEQLYIGDFVWVDSDNDLRNNNFDIPSDYTIFNGVPENLELPKTREQQLEDFVVRTLNMVDNITFPTESELKDLAEQAKALLNQ